MSKKRLGLGGGLDTLLGNFDDNDSTLSHTVALSSITSDPDQPRKYFDPALISELAQSIKSCGVIQPILVSKQGDGYVIIAGERRYRAAKEAGLKEIEVIVKDFSPSQRLEIALLENIQREDLKPIEEANAYQLLIKQSGLTQQQLADRIGKSRSYIANSLRLLDLPLSIQQATDKGQLTAGHARTLLNLEQAEQQHLYNEIKADKLTVRQTEQRAANLKTKKAPVSNNHHPSYPFKQVEQLLGTALKSNVLLKGDEHQGTILITYTTKEALDNLIKLLGSNSDGQ